MRDESEPWNESPHLLTRIDNPQDISWLVVFDTFACNYDRYYPRVVAGEIQPHRNARNVFLSEDGATGRFRLRVYDHTLCEYALMDAPGGSHWLGKIEDPTVFGLFPAFKNHLDREQVKSAAAKLGMLDSATIQAIIGTVPRQWIQSPDTPTNWGTFISRRAAFVARTIELRLFPQQELRYDSPR